MKAFGIRPGDLITVTYQKEGFNRQPFRVLKISPATNYRTMTITAQIHDDAWYADTERASDFDTGEPAAGQRRRRALPRPLVGSVVDANGNIQFGVVETDTTASDGTIEASVTCQLRRAGAVAERAQGRACRC